MLVFLAAMAGFCLSGDLFNLFVFFELMGAAAYALTGYKVEAQGPLEGALNFAVTNSVGAFLALTGLTLLYARTGALNLAQIGRALSGHPADGLVITAFVLLTAGLLIKGAVVPFHFWLDDAHAVAPTPVSHPLLRRHGHAGAVRRGPRLLDRLRRCPRAPRGGRPQHLRRPRAR